MASVQRKEIIIFNLLIVLTVSIGMAKSAAPTNITYTCDEHGVSSLQTTEIKKMIVLSADPGQGQSCRPTDSALSSCSSIQNKQHLIVVYDEESVNNIISHSSKYYDLKCTDRPSVLGVKANVFTVKSKTNIEVKEAVNIKHVFELKLKSAGSGSVANPINIGDELKLQMTGHDVVITPLNCSAYPNGNRNENITIWEFKNKSGKEECSNDHTSIISGTQWKRLIQDSHDIEITLYAFQFVSSKTVQIECFASVCSNGNHADCSEKCISQAGNRRRRAAPNGKNKDKYTRSSSISFAISANEDRANSSPGLSTGYTKFLLVALTLMCAYADYA